jgi:hypothetical protein
MNNNIKKKVKGGLLELEGEGKKGRGKENEKE